MTNASAAKPIPRTHFRDSTRVNTNSIPIVIRPTVAANIRCPCSTNKSQGPASQDCQGYKNRLYPYVFGQSGTAIPASVVVTRPPTHTSGKVAQANATAQ